MDRSNDYISQALRIANALMYIANDGDTYADEAGFGILSGVMRDCAYKIRRHAEQEKRKAKVAWVHANVIPVIFAVAALSFMFASPAKASTIILSTDMSETLGGLTFTDGDLAEYDSTTNTATLFFNENLFSSDEGINAVHVLANSNIILSTNSDATLGGLSFGDDDLVVYDSVTDTATMFFDGGSLFSSTWEDIDAVHILDSGNIILSTTGDATLGGLSFGDDDLVEYDPVTDTATMFLDGGSLFSSTWEDIDAAHILDDSGNIILSTTGDATLGGLNFGAGDLVEYNPTTDVATLYFDENAFASSANIDAVYVTTLPEPATVALLGLGFLVLIKNRKRINTRTLKYAGSPTWPGYTDIHVNHMEPVYNHRIHKR